jgi:hypothetical protein
MVIVAIFKKINRMLSGLRLRKSYQYSEVLIFKRTIQKYPFELDDRFDRLFSNIEERNLESLLNLTKENMTFKNY